MTVVSMSYGFRCTLSVSFEEAVERITASLKEEGFGILTEIDVQKTLREKLGAEFRRYLILGACNPQLAHQALMAEIDVGLLLPCNVIVYESDEGEVIVAAVDPDSMLGVVQKAALEPVAAQARERLTRALEALSR